MGEISGGTITYLDAKSRYNSTLAALIYLIEAESLIQPLVLVLEDAHYIDEDTLQFLPRLKRALHTGKIPYPVALVIASRVQGNPFAADEGLADATITLGSLSEEAVARQLEVLLGGPSAAGLTTLVLDRSEGNPFFIEQIVRYLQEESLIETRGDGWAVSKRVRDLFLPGDIRAMLVAHLRFLPQPHLHLRPHLKSALLANFYLGWQSNAFRFHLQPIKSVRSILLV